MSSSSFHPMNGVAAIRHYIDRMLNDSKSSGMKVFLLDAATTQIVSAVYSQTEILNKQVYLVTRLDPAAGSENKNNNNNGVVEKMGHLKAVVFCRPTPQNVECLGRELSQEVEPRFLEYHVYFSSIVTTGLLRLLAEQDAVHEKIASVHEFYCDFVPLNNDLWTLQTRHSLSMTTAAGTSWAPKYATQYERNLQGLQSMLLATKRQPSCIRYAGHSACAEELAKDLHDGILQDDVFTFRRPSSSGGLLVLVLDRRDDPVTPLLSQWTYQAMVHELLGLNNHRVLLRGAPNISKDLEEVVLNATQDAFFAKHRHSNFGQLGEAIQTLLQEYQQKTQSTKTLALQSIEEMQAMLEKFPELQSQSHVVSKHVAIMGELARLVELCHLMDVSQLEQELACNDDHNTHWRMLMEKLQSQHIKVPDKLRLGLLYALRYEQFGNLHMLQSNMIKHGVPQDLVQVLLPTLLRYAGYKSRGPGLYGHEPQNAMAKMTKSLLTSVQGIENVYAQHQPLLMTILHQVTRGKLSTRDYPVVPGSLAPLRGGGSAISSNNNHGELPIPDEILVFMVGGVTYEEGTKVYEFNTAAASSSSLSLSSSSLTAGVASANATNPKNIQVVLAGSTVHNSTSFLDELKATAV